jgi:hypothetical protein
MEERTELLGLCSRKRVAVPERVAGDIILLLRVTP